MVSIESKNANRISSQPPIQSPAPRTVRMISVVIHTTVNREEYQTFPSYNTRISPRKAIKFEGISIDTGSVPLTIEFLSDNIGSTRRLQSYEEVKAEVKAQVLKNKRAYSQTKTQG